VTEGLRPTSTAAGLTEPDDLWNDAERSEPQTYIGRLLVASGEHGHGYGAAVVEAVASAAREHGDKWLRLNCWSTNTRLHDYYRALDFQHVRTVDVPGRMSGALFERDLDNPRRNQFLDDQPDIRFGGPIITNFARPWPV